MNEPAKATFLWTMLALVIVGVLAAALLSVLSRPPDTDHPGPTLSAEVPPFRLTDQDGRSVGRDDLLGRPWIANFIFTNCAGPCPMMTSTLRSLQEEFPSEIRFVSFSVDPGRDTPERLRAYAKLHDADLSRWTFLTGDKEIVFRVAQQIGIAVQEKSPDDFIHGSRYVLIDARGRIRAHPQVVRESPPGWDVDPDQLALLRKAARDLLPVLPLRSLPTVNACLNGASALLLLAGLAFVKTRRIAAHKACMLAALTTSTIFLASYLTYHFQVGTTTFAGTGAVKYFYFALLASHTLLAILVLPLALLTVSRAFRGDFERHKRIARWTFPVWLYVSVTGVLVYFMLYHGFLSG